MSDNLAHQLGNLGAKPAPTKPKSGSNNLKSVLHLIKNSNPSGAPNERPAIDQATTLQRQQAAARQREKMIREGYWQEDEPAVDDERYQIDWGGAGEDTNASLFSESESPGATAEADRRKTEVDRFNIFSDLEDEEGINPQTEAGKKHKENVTEKPAGAKTEKELDDSKTGQNEFNKEWQKQNNPEPQTEAGKHHQQEMKNFGGETGKEAKENEKKETTGTEQKQKKDGDLKPQPLPADTEDESKKETDSQKKKEEAKQKQTTEQRIKNAQNQAKNNLKNAAKSAASLKVSDAQAAVELAAKQGSAALLTSMWGGVWLDWTGLTLLGLNIYLVASLFIDKLAQFGEDYLFGRWLGKELGKWVEIIILVIIDFFIISILFFVFYLIYRVWERGAWNILDFIWGAVKNPLHPITGGTSEVIKSATGQ